MRRKIANERQVRVWQPSTGQSGAGKSPAGICFLINFNSLLLNSDWIAILSFLCHVRFSY